MTPDERKRLAMYRRLFARLPEEIVLDMATRAFDMGDANVCGWSLRLAMQNGIPAEKIYLEGGQNVPFGYSRNDVGWIDGEAVAMDSHFGGGDVQWSKLFHGAYRDEEFPLIERAFVDRVAALCE